MGRILCLCLSLIAVSHRTARAQSSQAQPFRFDNYFLDDSKIRVSCSNDVSYLRTQLIDFIWNRTTLPTDYRKKVHDSPVDPAKLDDIMSLHTADVTKLAIDLDKKKNLQGFAYYIVPRSHIRSLVIVHQGHQRDFNHKKENENDLATPLSYSVNRLLDNGFSVLAVYMPGFTPNDYSGHAETPLRFFFDTTLYSLTWIKSNFPKSYQNYSMMGFSGGGWTTTIYAALDPTIKLSFPVAGSVPLYLRERGSPNDGDYEQYVRRLYQIVGYPDLYVLGSAGKGRKQVQVLNGDDGCCFGVKPYESHEKPPRPDIGLPEQPLRDYEKRIHDTLLKIGGSFRLEILPDSHYHQVSAQAMDIFLKELKDLNNSAK